VHFLLSVDPDMMGGFYVNDFNVFGHTWQVNVQAETTYRKSVDDIYRTYVRNAKGGMVPIRAVAQARLVQGPQAMVRYNGYRAAIINGAAKPGYSSGQALEAMRRVSATTLPPGYSFKRTGTALSQCSMSSSNGCVST
jgi:hydrophobic/amphiphilic exporter-1 (mainly G- bacteria), HAE1 family